MASMWWTEDRRTALHGWAPETIIREIAQTTESDLIAEARRVLTWQRCQELAAEVGAELPRYEAEVAQRQAERDDADRGFKLAEAGLDMARRDLDTRLRRKEGLYDATRTPMLSGDLGVNPAREAPDIEPDPDPRPMSHVQADVTMRKQALDRARNQLEVSENFLATAKSRLLRVQRIGPGLLAFEKPTASTWAEFLGLIGVKVG